jgi:hypothetical protein
MVLRRRAALASDGRLLCGGARRWRGRGRSAARLGGHPRRHRRAASVPVRGGPGVCGSGLRQRQEAWRRAAPRAHGAHRARAPMLPRARAHACALRRPLPVPPQGSCATPAPAASPPVRRCRAAQKWASAGPTPRSAATRWPPR